MILENTRFGNIQIDEAKIISMPSGMPGFPGRQRFVILEREETLPFYWYQCVDDPDLAFVIINPYLFKPDYKVNLQAGFREMSWEADSEVDIKLYAVVNASGSTPDTITANLMGPLLINTKRLESLQMVIPDSPYSLKHPIFTSQE